VQSREYPWGLVWNRFNINAGCHDIAVFFNKRTEMLLDYFRRLMRPWKIVTFILGTAFFIWGAHAFDAPTWDMPVSIIMSVVTFLLAPWSVDQLVLGVRRRGGQRLRLAAGLAGIYVCGSGSYEVYHLIWSGWHPPTYWENFFFSIPTAIVAGMIWRVNMSVAEVWTRVRAALHDG